MSELAPKEPKDLESVLLDGEWHPVMSGLSIRRGQPTSFWISEVVQDPFDPPSDHSNAVCFLVERFMPVTWARESGDLSTHGRAANLNSRDVLWMLVLEEGAFVKLNKPKPEGPPEAKTNREPIVFGPENPPPF